MAEKKSTGFTAEEKAAMRARAKELKAAEDGESAVRNALAAMSRHDRAMGERIHAIVKETAPDLTPKTWYGMPAYANKDGKVVVFFRNATKFKERYAMLGFNDSASLDDWLHVADRIRAERADRSRRAQDSRAREEGGELATDVHDAEAVALRVGEDDVVRVRRPFVPVDLGSAQRQQPFDLPRLVFGVQVEVEAWRDLQRGVNAVEGHIGPDSVLRAQQHEIVVHLEPFVAERRLPKVRLALQIVDAQHDRADPSHGPTGPIA